MNHEMLPLVINWNQTLDEAIFKLYAYPLGGKMKSKRATPPS